MVFEIKPKQITASNLAQAIGYVIAANSIFNLSKRPSPVGVLSDFIDQLVLIWVGNDEKSFYTSKEQEEIKRLHQKTPSFL
jgi:hypothetical protein